MKYPFKHPGGLMTPISILWMAGSLAGIYFGISQGNYLIMIISVLTSLAAISTWFGHTGPVKIIIVVMAVSLFANVYGIVFGETNVRYIKRAAVQAFFLVAAGFWVYGRESEEKRKRKESPGDSSTNESDENSAKG